MLRVLGESDHTAGDVFAGSTAPPTQQGHKRAVAGELILRFLATGERTADDLRSDVMAAGISETTFARARAELAEDNVIEQFQRGRRHWWRIAVPTAPPTP